MDDPRKEKLSRGEGWEGKIVLDYRQFSFSLEPVCCRVVGTE